MKAIVCDVCRKTIQDPTVERNCFHYGHHDLCESCKEELDLALRPIIRTKDPFNYEWYNQLVQDSIERAMEKGKF
jgi:predicted nucleic acid-binding OB-fold protein